jgi:hypothetical protein
MYALAYARCKELAYEIRDERPRCGLMGEGVRDLIREIRKRQECVPEGQLCPTDLVTSEEMQKLAREVLRRGNYRNSPESYGKVDEVIDDLIGDREVCTAAREKKLGLCRES